MSLKVIVFNFFSENRLPFQKELMKFENMAGRPVDHAADMQGSSPKKGPIERLKANNGDMNMSATALTISTDSVLFKKFEKPSPSSSTDSSPTATLKKTSKPRSPFLPSKTKRDVIKPDDGSNYEDIQVPTPPVPRKCPVSLAKEHADFPLKPMDRALAEQSPRDKMKSGGFIVNGNIIPPPPSRPPPTLKSEKPPHSLPGTIIS